MRISYDVRAAEKNARIAQTAYARALAQEAKRKASNAANLKAAIVLGALVGLAGAIFQLVTGVQF